MWKFLVVVGVVCIVLGVLLVIFCKGIDVLEMVNWKEIFFVILFINFVDFFKGIV